MADELSPGSSLQHFYLNRRELAKLSSSGSLAAPKVQYGQARVERARRESALVTDEIEKGYPPETLDDLFLLPEEVGGKSSFSNCPYNNVMFPFDLKTHTGLFIAVTITLLELVYAQNKMEENRVNSCIYFNSNFDILATKCQCIHWSCLFLYFTNRRIAVGKCRSEWWQRAIGRWCKVIY